MNADIVLSSIFKPKSCLCQICAHKTPAKKVWQTAKLIHCGMRFTREEGVLALSTTFCCLMPTSSSKIITTFGILNDKYKTTECLFSWIQNHFSFPQTRFLTVSGGIADIVVNARLHNGRLRSRGCILKSSVKTLKKIKNSLTKIKPCSRLSCVKTALYLKCQLATMGCTCSLCFLKDGSHIFAWVQPNALELQWEPPGAYATDWRHLLAKTGTVPICT